MTAAWQPESRKQHPNPRAALLQAASCPVPPPDPGFVSALEERLRMVHTLRESADGADERRPHPSAVTGRVGPGRRRDWLIPGAAALAVFLGGVITVARHSPASSGPTVQVAHAVDAEYVRADGHLAPVEVGIHLPEGTVISTGPRGALMTGGGDLGPDSEAVVHAGHLTPLPAQLAPHPSTPAPNGSSSDGAQGTGTVGAPPGSQRPSAQASRKAAESAGPSSDRAGPGGAAPAGTQASPPPAPKAETVEASDNRSATAPSPSSSEAVTSSSTRVTPKLSLHVTRSGTVHLSWTSYPGPGLYGYVVLRSNIQRTPAYPRDAIRFIGGGAPPVYNDGDSSAHSVYQIDAIDSFGDVLASSNVASTPAAQPDQRENQNGSNGEDRG